MHKFIRWDTGQKSSLLAADSCKWVHGATVCEVPLGHTGVLFKGSIALTHLLSTSLSVKFGLNPLWLRKGFLVGVEIKIKLHFSATSHPKTNLIAGLSISSCLGLFPFPLLNFTSFVCHPSALISLWLSASPTLSHLLCLHLPTVSLDRIKTIWTGALVLCAVSQVGHVHRGPVLPADASWLWAVVSHVEWLWDCRAAAGPWPWAAELWPADGKQFIKGTFITRTSAWKTRPP